MKALGQEKKRLHAIEDIVRNRRVANQTELKRYLEQVGVRTTQSSISRGLQKLGVIKLGGFYHMPGSSSPHQTSTASASTARASKAGASKQKAAKPRTKTKAIAQQLDIRCAGDHMVVVKTPPGKAIAIASSLDDGSISEIVGTIAGTDTVFISVSSKPDQGHVIRKITSMLN